MAYFVYAEPTRFRLLAMKRKLATRTVEATEFVRRMQRASHPDHRASPAREGREGKIGGLPVAGRGGAGIPLLTPDMLSCSIRAVNG